MGLFSSRTKYTSSRFDQKANIDDIYYCFRLILGRPPSEREWYGHSKLSGRLLKDIVTTYLTSKEFKNRNINQIDLTNIEVVELSNFKMYVPKDDPQVGIHIFENKIYESRTTEFIKNNLAPGSIFIDIGANIGYFSMLAAAIIGSNGKVFAFEPGQTNCKFLLINKNLNKFNNIEIFPLAAMNHKDIFQYDSSGSNGFVGDVDENIARVFESSVVMSTTVDDICATTDRLDMIKIDIEGAEYLAIKGAKETIKKHRPTIISEFSPDALLAVSKIDSSEYLRLLLEDQAYKIYALTESGIEFCDRNIDKVFNIFNHSKGDHIDIICTEKKVCNF
jgi:FkbM family methyltransferase